MFKIGKKLILTLAIFGAIFGLAACTQGEDVVRVKLDKEQFELIVGHSVEVMPIVTKGGLTTEANLGYKSYDESVVTYVNGKVTAIATGETTIKVYDIDHPLAYATATVVVKAAESLNAKFSYETSMFKGEEQLIKCELQLDSLNSIVSYKSANPDVATVDENGKVVAVATGNAIILARVTASSDENVYRDYALEITVVESDYKILYELDGGVNNEANPVGYNVLELPLELLEPTKKGYTFLGWYINDEKVEAIATGTTGDITIVAKWKKASYSIQYELDGGENATENPSEYTALDLPLTLKPATKAGYTFLGWYNGEAQVTEITESMIADLVLTAKWEKEEYALDVDLNGGEFDKTADVSNATALQEFTLSYYLSYNVNGYDACLHNSVSWGRWWYYISLKETGVNGLYEIVQIVAGSTKLTEEYDLVIGWHDSINVADRKTALFAMYNNSANYIGQYVELINVPTEATSECNIGVTVYDASTVQIMSEPMNSYTIEDEIVLPALTKEGYNFLGWFDGETKVEKIAKGTIGAMTLTAKWEMIVVKHNVEFELNGGVCTTLPTEYEEGKGLVLPTPTKEGCTFLGWYDNAECTGEAVTEISATANTDVKFYAQWEEVVVHEVVVDPNDSAAYQTIDAALEVANDGDTIVVKAGTFEGANITKSVTIKGANYGLNPNKDTRVDETIFTGDVVISASNVKLNGVKLTGAARIVLQENVSVANTLLENILVAESTINNSKSAPFYCLPSGEGIVYSNIVINNSRIEAANTRAMIMYGSQVNGLTITNCEFLGTSGSGQYNDGIKLNADTKYEYDICGNVLIKNNKFVNYCQYPVWFSQYAEGKYEFINNTFEGSALYTNYNDACFTMNTFKSNNQGGKVEVSVLYNTIKNSGILCRIQTASLTSETATVDVHYNKLINCLHTTFISDNGTNSLKLIDATNNYYSKTPTETNFTGVSSWEPFYANEADVPLYVEEGNAVSINYELNGGTLPDNAPTEFNPDNGVQHLPTPTYEGMIFMGWMMNGVIVTEIPAGTNEDVTLVAKWREDAIYVGESTEDYVLPTLAAALEIAKAGDKIILLPGTYDESITVSIANLTIAGPNQGINPNKETRTEEAVMIGVISIASSAVNFTIDGLAFTGNAQVVSTEASGNYSGFKFVNNKAYDTVEATEAWNAGRYTTTGFIEFRLASGGSTRNFTFMNNSFENVSYTNIICNRIINVVVSGNVFNCLLYTSDAADD